LASSSRLANCGADFLRQVFDHRRAKQQIHFHIFREFGLLQSGMKQIGEMFFPGRRFRTTRSLAVDLATSDRASIGLCAVRLREESKIGGLADQFQQVSFCRLDKGRT